MVIIPARKAHRPLDRGDWLALATIVAWSLIALVALAVIW